MQDIAEQIDWGIKIGESLLFLAQFAHNPNALAESKDRKAEVHDAQA